VVVRQQQGAETSREANTKVNIQSTLLDRQQSLSKATRTMRENIDVLISPTGGEPRCVIGILGK